MKKFNFDCCPVCKGELAYSKLICSECKSEFPVDVSLSVFDKLSEEQNAFLLLFLKSRGNINAISKLKNLPYTIVKKQLDDLLKALGLDSEEKEKAIDLSNFGDVDYESSKPSDVVRRKLYEKGGKVVIKLLDGKDCVVSASEDGKSITSDKLNNYSIKYDYVVFDIIVDLLKSKGGSAPKGNAYGKEDKVGYPNGKCTKDTIVGHIAINYSKKEYGNSAYDPVFVLAAILDWAGIAKNCRGYVQLNEEYMIDTGKDAMDKLAIKFEEELKDKVEEARVKYKYNASYFTKMIAQYGGVVTAKKLIEKAIRTGDPSEGYTKLFILDRLDLTMEDSVCKEEYQCLFTEEEIAYCKSVSKR